MLVEYSANFGRFGDARGQTDRQTGDRNTSSPYWRCSRNLYRHVPSDSAFTTENDCCDISRMISCRQSFVIGALCRSVWMTDSIEDGAAIEATHVATTDVGKIKGDIHRRLPAACIIHTQTCTRENELAVYALHCTRRRARKSCSTE